jgi:hypothetical protein
MPDFGAPIAQNVDVNPNKGLTTLSDLMGLQQKQIGIQQAQQTLQTGQALQATAQAEAQRNQQTMGERQLLQSSMQNGKDPDGNPLVGANGDADPVALTKFATKYLPMTGQDVVQNIVKTQDTRLKLADSARQLGQNYKNDVAGIIRSSMGDQNTPADAPGVIQSKIDAYVQQQGPNAPAALTQAASYSKSLLQNLGDHVPDAKTKSSLLHLAQQFEPTAAVAGTQAPAIGSVTGPGGGAQPVQLNPLSPLPMGATGPEVKTGVAPGIVMDLQGQPHYIGGAAGLGGGAAGGAAPSPWPTPAGVQAQSGVAKDMSDHFTGLNASAQSLPLVTGLTKTIEGLAPSAFTGPGGDKKQYMAGILRGFHINATGDAQTDTNLLNKAMAQLNISTPAGTDAARALVEAGQPNSHMDPDAIKEAAGTLRGQVMMNQAERNFLQTTRLSNRGAGDPQAYQEGRQQFEASADPRIWQYQDLAKSNPAAARAFIARQPDKADLVRKAGALEQMGFFR